MEIRFLDVAQQELDEAIEYDEQLSGLGHRFLVEVLCTLERIGQNPTLWRPFVADTRRCQTRRFPYGIVYQAINSEILIIAVAHLHREPGYWRNRL